ncbi:MAG: 3-deoxy-8-phosphooctulonate synthase [Phycisphaerae bacterium]|nr:3-deoxy-8-phosphooctulonate synthase [Phycisphaerae bacterium]
MTIAKKASIGSVSIGSGFPLAVIAGPCVIESREHTLQMADALAKIARRLEVPFVFKASFDKANRSSIESFRGPGLSAGLAILNEVRRELDVPVLTDIHLPGQADDIGAVVDCVQVPAFLCRQTDLLLAASKAGRCVNVKKGQFMSPDEMGNVVSKIASTGNRNILLTERGTFFGYHRLVNDMTSIERMKQFSPVVFDATHSCQLPGGQGHQTGGNRRFVGLLARSAIAAGADALFIEAHDNPDQAKSDPATQYPLDQFEALISGCVRIARAVRE